MNLNFPQKLLINRDIDRFIVFKYNSLRDAISSIKRNNGLPLIVLNNDEEFVGTLSFGDIARFLSFKENKIEDSIKEAFNKKSKYCFDDFDKSIYEHFLSEKIRIIPILDKYKKLKAVAYYEKVYFSISNKILRSDSNNIYLIAEIGVNHNGNINEAIDLIDNIYDAGFDAVKMQFRSSDTYSRDKLTNNIDLGTEYILSELERVNLSYEEEKEIIKYIKEKNLDFIGTPFDNRSLERLITYNPNAIKIASCDMTNNFLIKSCAKYDLPMILSTGMSNETEIIKTNKLLEDLNINRCFLHCNSTYPTPINDINLRYIERLHKITNCIAGYSSHDGDQIIALSSIAAGAKIVEVHITKDKEAVGTDHLASISINETKNFVKSAKKIAIAYGFANPRIPSQGELMNKIPLGKSLCYSSDFKKGYRLNSSEDFIACSPGDGISLDKYLDFHNKILNKNVSKLDKVSNIDFTEYESSSELTLTSITKETLKNYKWGIPVRYRDIEKLNQIFNPPLLEIHLSSKDLEFNIKKISQKNLFNKQLIVHAIEQYHDGFILDLASEKDEVIELSLKRFDELAKHCNDLLNHFGSSEPLKIVLNCGGFTKNGFCEKNTFEEKKKLLYKNLNILKNKYPTFKILPQTMPPFPWHQGGTSYHNLLRSPNDIKELYKETGLNICFDFSHSYMESDYSNIDFNANFSEIIKFADHLHLSDSSTSSNEGLNINDGNIDFEFTLNKIFEIHNKEKITFIPEVWQGHLNNGEGFRISLERIVKYLI